jgi:hypothetical protein
VSGQRIARDDAESTGSNEMLASLCVLEKGIGIWGDRRQDQGEEQASFIDREAADLIEIVDVCEV